MNKIVLIRVNIIIDLKKLIKVEFIRFINNHKVF